MLIIQDINASKLVEDTACMFVLIKERINTRVTNQTKLDKESELSTVFLMVVKNNYFG
jgi:hypothetical protein